MPYDAVIVGGGPAGLSAALTLGRARKRVLLCDAGPPRNAAAALVHGFVTRDGTPPSEFRRIAREQLAPYDSVDARDVRVEGIDGDAGQFVVRTSAGSVEARRVLLCTGMVDELPSLPGYRELWGRSVFQCPYCHAWEVRGSAFGYLVPAAEWLEWSMFLKGWTDDVVAFTDGAFAIPDETRRKLDRAQVRIEERRLAGLRARQGHLAAVQLEGGAEVPRDVLFARPPQRQGPLVGALGLTLDDQGFVVVDGHKQTSRPGIYAAGDLTTPVQSAILAAAAGAQAAGTLNHELTLALVLTSTPSR
ncbi:NAD(P)/FAD-dependent oxidoreductase [Sorangium sp. So ce1014]|uniref:NAD(P)/FAD-dependent oxidoreductase n=1 Tax=Sorangium sp. So ce1014 TaxID=3133326 RepID=UPI003F601B44